MIRTMYSSVATEAIDDAALDALVRQSRRNNERDGITGVLVHRDGRFLQVLEGPEEAVASTMSTISRDPRHHRVRTLLTQRAERRAFAEWTMGYRPLTPESDELGRTWTADPDAADSDSDSGRDSESEWLLIVDRLTHWYRMSTTAS